MLDPVTGSRDSTSSTPDEVKWQVAFFALLPLAVGAMTQPVGRVCDMPPDLRVLLRSSPIICVTDMLLFLLRVLIDYYLEPAWSWQHFKAELAYRFRDEDWSKEPNEFEKALLGRWILILLGGIPCQTIKLIAMQGIPWTQTFAIMFFVSQVFGEVLNITAETVLRKPGIVNTLDQAPPSNAKSFWLNFIARFCYCTQVITTWNYILVPLVDSRLGSLFGEGIPPPTGEHIHMNTLGGILFLFLCLSIADELEELQSLTTLAFFPAAGWVFNQLTHIRGG